MDQIEKKIYLAYYVDLIKKRHRLVEARKTKRKLKKIRQLTLQIQEVDKEFQYIFDKMKEK